MIAHHGDIANGRVDAKRSDEEKSMRASFTYAPTERRGPPARASTLAWLRERLSGADSYKAEPGRLVRLAETLAITAVVPVLGHALRPDDPFSVRGVFFWPLFAPVLVSLRYGAGAGATSTLAIALMLIVDWKRHDHALGQLPLPALVGVFALVLICGQFAEIWDRSVRRLESALEKTTSELSELSREQFLLELSHDRIEASRAGDCGPSLRASLSAIREIACGDGPLDKARVADHVMRILTTACLVDVAALHEVHGGRLVGGPLARIGQPDPLPAGGDDMVAAALRSGQLACSPQMETAGESPKTKLILAAPLTDSSGLVRAVLCVQSMPFIALDTANLRLLAVVCGHAADLLAAKEGGSDHRRARRDEFGARIERAARDVEHGLPATVVCLLLRPEGPLRDIAEQLLREVLRATDHVFLEADEQRALIAVLLAGTDGRGAAAFERRVRELAARKLGTPVPRLGNSLLIHRLARGDTGQSVLGRLRTKDLVA